MKWSEQMRELISVDENFNQLEYDFNEYILSINGEFIAEALPKQVQDSERTVTYIVQYKDYNKIIKKYPFFTDAKFLLNCIFTGGIHYTKAIEIKYGEDRIEIQNYDSTRKLVIYTEPQVTP